MRSTPALVLFDGDCGVCERVAEAMAARHGPAVAVWRPWQREPSLPPGVARERLEREIVLVRPDGRVEGGHRVFTTLLRRTPGWRAVGLVLAMPGVGAVAALGYRLIAAGRRGISRWLGLRTCGLRR